MTGASVRDVTDPNARQIAVSAGVRVLTVRQPHAWALAAGLKDVENRPRPAPAGAPYVLGILAGLKFDPPLRVPVDEPEVYVHGAVIGAVTVESSHEFRCDEPRGCVGCVSGWALHSEGTHHWMVGRAVMLPRPIPMRGSLSTPYAPADVDSAIRDAYASKGWPIP